MNRRNLLTRSGQAALGLGATAFAIPFVTEDAEAASGGSHTHDEYLDEPAITALIDGKFGETETRLLAIEAIVFADPAPTATPTPTPTPVSTLPHYTVIRDCRYDGAGWMPTSHDAAGVVSYIKDPLGSGAMVASYDSTGRAENWHSDQFANLDKDKSTFIYRGGFLFTEQSFADAPSWYIFRQWHNGNGSPAFSFQVKNDGTVKIVRRNTRSDGSENDEVLATLSLADLTGDWNDYSVLAIWSKGSDGRFQVKLNGKVEVDYSGPTLKPTATTMYGKNGGYHFGGHVVTYARRLFIARSEAWDERLHEAV